MPRPPRPSAARIWPAIHPRLLELVEQHRSTLIFVNARRLAERLATRLNELALEGENRAAEAEGRPPEPGREVVKAHHGSLSRERRLQIEDELKRGDLKGLVATSSLELGIDMGAVDLVIQVESPGAVSRGLQRIGRAGHQVGEPSRGKLFPKHRNDLVEAAVVVQRMHDGLIEHTRYPRNPLDVLAQQIVAMCALDDWPVDDLAALVRRSATYADLSDEVLTNVLDLLAGRYPSDEFAELRPRIVWDRVEGVVRGRAGAQRLAVTSGGTIPDRGLYGVFLPDGTRVGELDEEMVYESRVGETFLLGATTWRIEDITHERVVVSPAPGQPGKMPFWHGDGPGRPLELGRAVGAFVREVRAEGAGAERASAARPRPRRAGRANLVAYLDEQAEASGGAVPDDRTIVVERFRDEIGDWRVCVLSPFGAQVHAPWGMALRSRLAERWGLDVELMWSDDGIVLRLPEAVDELPLDELTIDPDDIDEIVMAQLPQTALFASRFRECAARALLLPRRRPDRRTPLWQQRQKAADLLSVAAKYPDFPILLEATRECVNDVFDLPGAARGAHRPAVASGAGGGGRDAPGLTVRPVAVVRLDRRLHVRRRCAAGRASGGGPGPRPRPAARPARAPRSCASCSTPSCSATSSSSCSDWSPGARPATPTRSTTCCACSGRSRCGRSRPAATRAPTPWPRRAWVDRLVARASRHPRRHRRRGAGGRRRGRRPAARRAGRRPAGGAAHRVHRLGGRTARRPGVALRPDPRARSSPRRWPVATGSAAERVLPALERLEQQGRVVRGEFRPDGIEREWCDDDVLRQLRRRSLAALRHEVEPVDARRAGPLPPAVAGAGAGPAGARRADRGRRARCRARRCRPRCSRADILAARVAGFRPADLDALCTSGEVVWVGAGALGSTDGRVRLLFRDQAGLLVPAADPGLVDDDPPAPVHAALRGHLSERGASFWPELVQAVAAADQPYDEPIGAGPRCGTWCGPARSPTTRWPRCGPRWAASGRRGGAGRAGAATARPRRGLVGRARLGARPDPRGLTPARARRRSRVAGRWWPRCSCRGRRPPRRPTPRRCSCSSVTAC